MRARPWILFVLLAWAAIAPAAADSPPDLSGNITRVRSPNDFDVAYIHVLLSPSTRLQAGSGTKFTTLKAPDPVLGHFAIIFGHLDRDARTIKAKRIVFFDSPPDSQPDSSAPASPNPPPR